MVNALSREDMEGKDELMLISFPNVQWIVDLKATCEKDAQVYNLFQLFSEGKLGPEYTIREGHLLHKTDVCPQAWGIKK